MAYLQISVGDRVFLIRIRVIRLYIGHEIEGASKKVIPQLLFSQKLFLHIIKQTAVISHDSILRIAVIDSMNQSFEVFPEIISFMVCPVAPPETMGLKAEGLDGMFGINLLLFHLGWQKAAGLGVEEEKAPIEELDGAFEYLPSLLLGVFFTLAGSISDETVTNILEDFVNLLEKRGFDFILKELLRSCHVLVQTAGINTEFTGVFLPLFFALRFRRERVHMEECLKKGVLPFIILRQGLGKIKLHIFLKGLSGTVCIEAPPFPIRQDPPGQLAMPQLRDQSCRPETSDRCIIHICSRFYEIQNGDAVGIIIVLIQGINAGRICAGRRNEGQITESLLDVGIPERL
ncbi:MAG: hypothetical protein KKA48_06750 [Proteobacteria bacterium]|nr:hypothetical protein [Pseudomonadota bacterium]